MYESYGFDELMQKKLDMIDGGFDKRQGSVIYDAMAPNAAESAKLYMAMEMLMDRTFADTACGVDLERRTAERNIKRRAAVAARIKAEFYDAEGNLFDISIGDRFLGGDYNYRADDKISEGIYILECETAGECGNSFSKRLIPVEYIEGLAYGNALEIIVYGEDDESDESLRKRYFESFSNKAFGGNIDDYKSYFGEMENVGGVKIYPAYYGGGSVRAVITSNGYTVPAEETVKAVQQKIDPVPKGSGLGIAPIGHNVSVEPCGSETINIAFKISFNEGYDWEKLQEEIKAVTEEYLAELRYGWANCDNIIVRTSYIEMRILSIAGVLDVEGTTINNAAENYHLEADNIPVLGTVEAV